MVDAALIKTLSDLIKDEFSLFWHFKKEVQKLSSTLSSIDAVLEDAERKGVPDNQTEDFLRKMKEVAYEVRDIVDGCIFEDLRLQVNRLNASSSTRKKVTHSISHPFSNTWTRFKVGHKIKAVQEKLDQISSERTKYHLPTYGSNIHKFTRGWRQTMSVSSSKVFGRDKEKEEIIDILLNNTSSAAKNLSVLPIVGIGGLGKTTLAQMVFNDEKIADHFNTKIWVCVSEEFDVELVIKAIIGENINTTTLDRLREMIQDKLKGQRYLIVLDDVWNEDEEKWAQLRTMLDCGSDGAFILTTTRKRMVAEIMGTIQYFKLSSLSDDGCWSLFEERAFLDGKSKASNLVVIGKAIVKKCMGVPLIVKTLGSQLKWKKDDEKEWCRIRDSEIWEIFQNEESDLLPIIRLSYYDLPYNLRKCFVFCAIFPKDTEMEKEKLIQLWMAHGLIHKVKNQEMEEVGNTIWNELCWRSFFEDEKEKRNWLDDRVKTTCKMHDIMHDLAQSFMKDECYTMNANISSSSMDGLGREIRHQTIRYAHLENISVCSFKKIGGLQSIRLHCRDVGNVRKVFKELPSLRVFEGSVRNVQYLPYMGRLKHLRYLDISKSKITTLPNSICDLLNLQTLNLNRCSELKSLPRNTGDLINLRHLYLEGCYGLKYMPGGMGRLKHLKTLCLILIGKKETDCQLDEIKELDVGGSLTINNLERVSDASIERGISMAKKTSINHLNLNWTTNDEDGEEDEDSHNKSAARHEKIGEALEVSTARLKKLRMIGYKGVNPPKWVGKLSPSPTHLKSNESSAIKDDNEMIVLFPLLEELHIFYMKNLREFVPPSCLSTGAFSNLSELTIHNCPKLGRLPPHLKALKDVSVSGECSDELLNSIWNLNGLTHLTLSSSSKEHIVNNMNGIIVIFPLLEKLEIWNMKNLRELVSSGCWSTCTGAFLNLSKIVIYNCPKLGRLPTPHLKALKEVSLGGECSDELLNSIWNLNGLTHLTLCDSSKEHIFTVNNMNGIIVLFPLLKEFGICRMKNLRELVSSGCWSTCTGAFLNLSKIQIFDCPKLGALPVPHLKALKHVHVEGECSDELLNSISNLSALTLLEIYHINERSVLFGAGKALMLDDEIPSSSSSSSQILGDNNNNEAAQLGVRSTFQSLQSLTIKNCKKLRRLFDDEGMIMEETLKISGGQNEENHHLQRQTERTRGLINSLTKLYIYSCPKLMISVEEFGKLDMNNSLQILSISECPKLVSSEDVKALLRSLRTRLGGKNFNVRGIAEEEE